MKFQISDLMDSVTGVDVDMKPDTTASAQRIKELTMKKLHENQPTRENQRRTRRPLSLLTKGLIAAVLMVALAVPAMAAVGFSFTDWLKQDPSKAGKYDTDLSLGSVSKAWEASGWTVELSAEAASPTGLTVKCTHWTNHAAPPLTGTLAADESYWLETWNGESYDKLPDPKTPVPAGKTLAVEKDTTAHWPVSWAETYGTLEDGSYRLGKNFTYTSDDGKTETVPMYVKFRVFSQDMDTVVKQCRDLVEELKDRESYHVVDTHYTGNYGPNQSTFDRCVFTYWKSGKDYLEERAYYSKDGKLAARDGYLLRDGKGYKLTWTGDSVLTPLESWETANFVEQSGMEMWSWPMEIYDNNVGEVSGDEDSLRVLTSLIVGENDPEYTELLFTKGADGKLVFAQNAAAPGKAYTEDQLRVMSTLEVLDTKAEEIALTIATQAVDKPLTFSWEADQAQYPAGDPSVKTGDFANTTSKPIANADEAIARAKAECTLQYQNMASAVYDEAAQMWKVTLSFSQDSDRPQYVYLTSDGITKLVVTK